MKRAKSRIKKNYSRLVKKIIATICFVVVLVVAEVTGYLLGIFYKASQSEPEPVASRHFIIELITPTPTPAYMPSKTTRALINANPGFSGKLKSMYGSEWRYAAELIARESSFNPGAINPTSGACGLGQALPCSKMKCELTDIDCQLRWLEEYVIDRYVTFEGAIWWHDLKKQQCLDKQARGEISQDKVCAGWY